MSPNSPRASGGNPFPGMSANEIIDVIYRSCAVEVSTYFDETHFGQPQGIRIMNLVKQGIADAVNGQKKPIELWMLPALILLLGLSPVGAAGLVTGEK